MHNQTVRATVFKANAAAPQTKQIYEDDFSELYGEDIIAPPTISPSSKPLPNTRPFFSNALMRTE